LIFDSRDLFWRCIDIRLQAYSRREFE